MPTENPIQPFSAQRNIVTLSWGPEENGRNNNSPDTRLSFLTIRDLDRRRDFLTGDWLDGLPNMY